MVKAYKWCPRSYAENSSVQLLWAKEIIDMAEIRPSAIALDIGCGDGKITALLANKVPQGKVYGIDLSEEMIEFAQQNHRSENLSFHVMDANRLQFDFQFDFIFSNATFHWIKDHLTVLKAVSQHMRPDGRLFINIAARGNIPGILDSWDKVSQFDKWKKYFTDFEFPFAFYGKEEYEKWLPEAGFEIVNLEYVRRHVIHQNIDALRGWIETTQHPYIDSVPEENRQEFIDEFMEYYIGKYPAEADGTVVVKMVHLKIVADNK